LTARPMGRHVLGPLEAVRRLKSVGVLPGCRLLALIPGLFMLAECLHPEDAEQLRRAQEAWERDAEDRRQ
jgi:hypothetical protein